MKKWLAHILSNGTLVDNQVYFAKNGKVSNPRIGEITFNEAGRRTQSYHYNDKVFQALFHKQSELDKIRKQAEVILFNEGEYEHNTEDNLYNLTGLDYRNFKLSTGNLIGFIKIGDYSIRIGSRFGNQFLKYLISDAHGFMEIKNVGGYTKDNSFEWLLYYLWQVKLKKAFRLGIPKTYQSRKQILKKAIGQIDPLHYELYGHLGQYDCNYREQSYVNEANILIAQTFSHEQLFKHCNSEMNGIRNGFITATKGRKLQRKQLLRVQYFKNPYFQEYNEVIDLSKRIIFSEGLSIESESESSAFLFDVSMLFEYFIKKLFIRNGFQVLSKFENNLKIPTGTRNRKLEPDIVVQTEKGVIVLDVKYKHFDNREGVKREDLFQMHTYVGQYANDDNVLGFGLIYPASNGNNKVIKEKTKVAGKHMTFYILQLGVPKDNDGFYKDFQENINEFMLGVKDEFNTKN